MMQVELTKKISWGGIFRNPGDILTGPEHLMRTLIAEGNAQAIKPPSKTPARSTKAEKETD